MNQWPPVVTGAAGGTAYYCPSCRAPFTWQPAGLSGAFEHPAGSGVIWACGARARMVPGPEGTPGMLVFEAAPCPSCLMLSLDARTEALVRGLGYIPRCEVTDALRPLSAGPPL